jgi:hypothetical protein
MRHAQRAYESRDNCHLVCVVLGAELINLCDMKEKEFLVSEESTLPSVEICG